MSAHFSFVQLRKKGGSFNIRNNEGERKKEKYPEKKRKNINQVKEEESTRGGIIL